MKVGINHTMVKLLSIFGVSYVKTKNSTLISSLSLPLLLSSPPCPSPCYSHLLPAPPPVTLISSLPLPLLLSSPPCPSPCYSHLLPAPPPATLISSLPLPCYSHLLPAPPPVTLISSLPLPLLLSSHPLLLSSPPPAPPTGTNVVAPFVSLVWRR